MTETDKFCLKWNEFDSNLRAAFKDFREEEDFFDVTLVCEEERQIEAHKIILSACSLLFRKILKQNKHQHPLIYLKDIKYSELLSLLNFMYLGEVQVAQEDLSTFLSAAEELKVNGLAQNSKNSSKSNSTKPDIKKDIIQVPRAFDNSPAADYDIAEVSEPFSSQSSSINIGAVSSVTKNEFYQMYDDTNDVAEDNFSLIYDTNTGKGAFDSYMTKIRDELGTMVMYECNACKKTMRRKDHMKNHVQTHFPQQEVNCQICGATCKNIPSLKVHLSAKHRKGQNPTDTDTDSNPLTTSPITITDHLV